MAASAPASAASTPIASVALGLARQTGPPNEFKQAARIHDPSTRQQSIMTCLTRRTLLARSYARIRSPRWRSPRSGGHLPGGDVEAVPGLVVGDGEDQRRERRLVIEASAFLVER